MKKNNSILNGFVRFCLKKFLVQLVKLNEKLLKTALFPTLVPVVMMMMMMMNCHLIKQHQIHERTFYERKLITIIAEKSEGDLFIYLNK